MTDKFLNNEVDEDGFKVKHPTTKETLIEDHGIVGNMHCMMKISNS